MNQDERNCTQGPHLEQIDPAAGSQTNRLLTLWQSRITIRLTLQSWSPSLRPAPLLAFPPRSWAFDPGLLLVNQALHELGPCRLVGLHAPRSSSRRSGILLERLH
jgi:hypothetical protein